ncbi:MAG TPA: hypothetical protein VFJ16_06615 [Longimicrobium sp.]|nr:hypothetical protein [Longimicrobium sp.]
MTIVFIPPIFYGKSTRMRHSPLHGIIFTSMLAATGCGTFAAKADPLHGPSGAAWGLSDVAAGARPVFGRTEFRVESDLPGTRIGRAPGADAPITAPAEPADTTNLEPGALLDVWLSDRNVDIRTITTERSLGTAVVQGDFFRYNVVNSDPDLRGFWGQPLLLKWSALLEIPDRGAHVFAAELSRERGGRAIQVRTMVRVDEETVFEKQVRVFLGNPIFETSSRVLTLAPGYHRLEVWLAVDTRQAVLPASQLGIVLKIRPPGQMTAEPVQPSRIWHRVR